METMLTERQKNILRIIVGMYVKTVTPVGSRNISKFYQNKLSPATIRNEMHDLEERGLIKQPHTSAGRIPTDDGYRYYVDHLMNEVVVPPHLTTLIAREFRDRIDNLETLIEKTSKILSSLSEQAGIVIFPMLEDLTVKRIELTLLAKKHLLVVWVLSNGVVQNKVVDLNEEIPPLEIERVGRFLNNELSGLPMSDVMRHLEDKFVEAKDALRSLSRNAHSIVRESFPVPGQRRLSLQGSRYILDQPEFQDWEKSKRLFKTLEEHKFLMDLVQSNLDDDGVRVQIGLEHHCQDIWDCSFVTARYCVNKKTVGALGILGPRRMPYERVISLVDHMSRRFSEALEQWF